MSSNDSQKNTQRFNYLNDKTINNQNDKQTNDGSKGNEEEQKESEDNDKSFQKQNINASIEDNEGIEVPLITNRLSRQFTKPQDYHTLTADEQLQVTMQKNLLEEKLQLLELVHPDLADSIHLFVFVELIQKNTFSAAQIKFIQAILFQFSIFKNNQSLSENKQLDVKLFLKYTKLETFEKREKIFQYGDLGQKYYMLLKGKVLLFIPKGIENEEDIALEKQKVQNEEYNFYKRNYPNMYNKKILYPGESFGEISLMTNQTRTATMVCSEECWLLTLSKEGFDKLLGSIHTEEMRQNTKFISQYEIIQSLSNNKIFSLLHNMTKQTFKYNNIIYSEEQNADYIYFIKNGQVEISKITHLQDQPTNNNNNIKSKEDVNQNIDTSVQQSLDNLKIQKKNSLYSLNRRNKFSEKVSNFKRVKMYVLSENNYFGHQELLSSNPGVRQYQAQCVSEQLELMVIKKNILLSYLKTSKEQRGIDILMMNLHKQSQWQDSMHEDQVKMYSAIKQKSFDYCKDNHQNPPHKMQNVTADQIEGQDCSSADITSEQKRLMYQANKNSIFSNFSQSIFKTNQLDTPKYISRSFSIQQSINLINQLSDSSPRSIHHNNSIHLYQDLDSGNNLSPKIHTKTFSIIEINESGGNKNQIQNQVKELSNEGYYSQKYDKKVRPQTQQIVITETLYAQNEIDQIKNDDHDHEEDMEQDKQLLSNMKPKNLWIEVNKKQSRYHNQNEIQCQINTDCRKKSNLKLIMKRYSENLQKNRLLEITAISNEQQKNKQCIQIAYIPNSTSQQQFFKSVPTDITLHNNVELENIRSSTFTKITKQLQKQQQQQQQLDIFSFTTHSKSFSQKRRKPDFQGQEVISPHIPIRKIEDDPILQSPQQTWNSQNIEANYYIKKHNNNPINEYFCNKMYQDNNAKAPTKNRNLSSAENKGSIDKRQFIGMNTSNQYYTRCNSPKSKQVNYFDKSCNLNTSKAQMEQLNKTTSNMTNQTINDQEMSSNPSFLKASDFKQQYIKQLLNITQQKEEIYKKVLKQQQNLSTNQSFFFDFSQEKKLHSKKQSKSERQFTMNVQNQGTGITSCGKIIQIKSSRNQEALNTPQIQQILPEQQNNLELKQNQSDLIVKNIKEQIIKRRKVMIHTVQNPDQNGIINQEIMPIKDNIFNFNQPSQQKILKRDLKTTQFPLILDQKTSQKIVTSKLNTRQADILKQFQKQNKIISPRFPR